MNFLIIHEAITVARTLDKVVATNAVIDIKDIRFLDCDNLELVGSHTAIYILANFKYQTKY